MKRSIGLSVIGGALAAALISGVAYAHGFGGHGHESLVPPIVGHMVSHDQMRTIFQAEKGNLQSLHSQLRTAREQLETDLIAGNSTAADLQALQTAQNSLLAEKVKIAQEVMASLSSAQRTQVSQFVTQWRSLKAQQMALFKQYGGGPEASSSPSSSQSGE
ncbi:MAG: Spy/CpxP family protein refolding chaperone [Candidatus Binataceae bacterium]